MKRWSFVPLRAISPWWWLPVSVVLVTVDYATGPYFQFPSVYILVVVVASWFSGLPAGLTLAVVLPLSRAVLMTTVWDEPWDTLVFAATAATRIAVSLAMALLTARLAEHERLLSKEVAVLTALLPICTYCRKIKDNAEQWSTLDDYVARRQDEFSTDLCPTCAQANFPEHFAPRQA